VLRSATTRLPSMKCMLERGSGSRLDYPVPHNSASIRHERLPRSRKAMVGSYLEGTGFSHVSSTAFRSFISAMTVLLQSTSGTTLLAQEGQATTARASANDRRTACQQSIEKVINLCMIRGLNNIGRMNCDCVQDGRTWTCTGTAACTK